MSEYITRLQLLCLLLAIAVGAYLALLGRAWYLDRQAEANRVDSVIVFVQGMTPVIANRAQVISSDGNSIMFRDLDSGEVSATNMPYIWTKGR